MRVRLPEWIQGLLLFPATHDAMPHHRHLEVAVSAVHVHVGSLAELGHLGAHAGEDRGVVLSGTGVSDDQGDLPPPGRRVVTPARRCLSYPDRRASKLLLWQSAR